MPNMVNKIRGCFLNLESLDGLGKTTQLVKIKQYLTSKGFSVIVTKEPGDDQQGSNIGPQIRKILFDKPGTSNLAPGVCDLLFLADHLQNEHMIKPLLDEGNIVISDRYFDSELAYAPANNCPKWVLDLYKERSEAGVVPNITLLFIAINSEKTGDLSWVLNRANNRSKNENTKQKSKKWNNLEKLTSIQNNYLENLSSNPRTKLIPILETDTIQDVFSQIKIILYEHLKHYDLIKSYEH